MVPLRGQVDDRPTDRPTGGTMVAHLPPEGEVGNSPQSALSALHNKAQSTEHRAHHPTFFNTSIRYYNIATSRTF